MVEHLSWVGILTRLFNFLAGFGKWLGPRKPRLYVHPVLGVCFPEAVYTLNNVHRKAGPVRDRTTAKLNAFEGGLLADLDFSVCYLEGRKADCDKTDARIQDAMQH
jgi:hypothetical protein